MTTLVLPLLLADAIATEDPATRFIRLLTVFLLAMWVGFEVITKVPQRLHTPLTSGSNAISGITAVGAIVVAGALTSGVGTVLGFLAMVLAMINVVGGFVVTHRMLAMFQPRKK
jgi:NAD(P) transhydrogenase subunit alpha